MLHGAVHLPRGTTGVHETATIAGWTRRVDASTVWSGQRIMPSREWAPSPAAIDTPVGFNDVKGGMPEHNFRHNHSLMEWQVGTHSA